MTTMRTFSFDPADHRELGDEAAVRRLAEQGVLDPVAS